MTHKFLLIGNREDSPSFYDMWNALSLLGELQVLPQEEALRQIPHTTYDIIIVDAAILDSGMHLISQIRKLQPKTLILVLTASPTWRRAREAFKAGAVDYLNKSLDMQGYLNRFRDLLKQASSART